ncbi:MAG: magnesium transporter, partial [Candidatus Syntrophonatronum acetioxidans]
MVEFKNIEDCFERNDMNTLKSLVAQADIFDIIKLIEDLPSEERVVVFRLLDKEKALETFEQLEPTLQQELIFSFKEERAIEIFSEMDPDDQARLLDELPARVAKTLLASLSPEERRKTADLMGYPPGTAGRIMTPEYVRLRRNITVEEALKIIKEKGKDKETVYTLYVTDNKRKLEGVVSLRDLVMASADERVEEVMKDQVVSVGTETNQEEVARILQDRDLLAVPVVDKENRLVGIITIDDAVDILEEETTRDIFDKVGITSFSQRESARSHRLVTGSLWEAWKVRVPFLIITLIGGLLAGAVIGAYEETLEAIAAVAIFIPVIMDMGGNVGTQSSTIFTRAFVLGHINLERFGRYLLREMG